MSRHRVPRMRAIAQHLALGEYDLVLLQEVWCPSDYEHISKVTRDVLPYRHFFDQGIIGTGTCVLSREPITEATFHEFSMNGYPHKVLHGDWFAGKGLGVVTLDYRGLNIHVFVSHLHAEYNRRGDIYLGHRVLQALEAAQWVRLTSPGADLTIYGGDFNTEPGDVPYKLLRCVGNLKDSWEEANGPGGGHSCGARGNTYSTSAELAEFPLGKRIDYIMYSAGRGRTCRVTMCSLPLPPSIPSSLASLAGQDCSYSDHEAVVATLTVKDQSMGSGDSDTLPLGPCTEETVTAALSLLALAIDTVGRDQLLYSLLTTVTLLAFGATFTQLLVTDSVLLECLMFLLRLLLTLCGLFTLLMATVFNRRERHALRAGRAALLLLQSQRSGYGSI